MSGGLLVGFIYALLNVRSMAPPMIALVGLREFQHAGSPGKSPPAPVTRRVRVCQPAGVSPDRVRMSR